MVLVVPQEQVVRQVVVVLMEELVGILHSGLVLFFQVMVVEVVGLVLPQQLLAVAAVEEVQVVQEVQEPRRQVLEVTLVVVH